MDPVSYRRFIFMVMKKIKYSLSAALMIMALSAAGQKAVFVIADGIPADMIERAAMPNMKAIIKAGSYTRAIVGGDKGSYNQSPTISAVGYNSVITGTWANKHNVLDNSIAKPNYYYKNIFRLFKEQYPKKRTAVFSSWLDNRTKLVGDGLPQAGEVTVDLHADGYELDTITYRHDAQKNYMHQIDEKIVAEASKAIREESPDLSWVYLEYTDDMGHAHGDSKQMDQAIAYLDQQIGSLWNAIQYRQREFKEQWLIIITTDHGRSAANGRDHGGQSPRERSGWIVANTKLNEYAERYDAAIVDIMPTIARHLKVHMPLDVSREVDGIPLIGPVSVTRPTAHCSQGKLDIGWKAMAASGMLKIWVSTTNMFSEGGRDDYKLMAELPLKDRHAVIDVSSIPSSFYKIVLESKENTTNTLVKCD